MKKFSNWPYVRRHAGSKRRLDIICAKPSIVAFIQCKFGRRFEAFGTFNIRLSSTDNRLFQLDITKEDNLKKKINEIKPEIVLNTTALHNVDYCESHPEEAFNINSKVVGVKFV
jgi:hypothetical protein